MVGYSLIVQSRDNENDALFWVVRADSAQMEMIQAQNRTIELEGLLDDFSEELKEKSKAMARLEAEVAELKKKEALAKKKAIEEFKSLDDFQKAVITLTSTYFNEGFDFQKTVITWNYPLSLSRVILCRFVP